MQDEAEHGIPVFRLLSTEGLPPWVINAYNCDLRFSLDTCISALPILYAIIIDATDGVTGLLYLKIRLASALGSSKEAVAIFANFFTVFEESVLLLVFLTTRSKSYLF